jgi:hypothetical protein
LSKYELSNLDVTLFVLYKLGGAQKKIHTEYIAWEAFKLAPEKFSWRLKKFRKKGFPDKTPVRHALETGKKEGNLVIGQTGGDRGGKREGWRLTPNGVVWIKQNLKRISTNLGEEAPSSLPKEEARRFLKKIKKSQLFNHFLSDNKLSEATNYMLIDMLNCTPEAPEKTIKRIFTRFHNIAIEVKDKEILYFLEQCINKFDVLK